MRSAPQWFQDELTRIGGTNRYGEPIFKLVWSTEPRTCVGGRFQRDGHVGYRMMPAVPGEPCWALMTWDSPEMFGAPWRWEYDYRDEETGLLDCGAFPRHGRYRLLQRFMHRELQHQEVIEPVWVGNVLEHQRVRKAEFVTYKMEPNGLMLDIMIPMLKAWMKLSGKAKIEALKQAEQQEKDKFLKMAKDLRDSIRVKRGSQLVQKRAELIEKGMQQAMRVAAQSGLGMRQG